MIKIVQGGQTGVDRGAWRGAVECGLERGGWMPADGCDELGLIPNEARSDLRPALNGGGNRARTIANILDSDAVLIVVPDAAKGCTTPGTRLTWKQARDKDKPRLVIDGSDRQVAHVAPWLRELLERWSRDTDSAIRLFRLMLAGPRASLWPEGEETARRVVHAIAEVCR
ncbi:MAG TPA: putative molybdenum carrier protein [Candidatus Binatia bacterium]|nr:putative molybdenum carrier protein [Candidatus Binatia bacterium]